MSMGWNQRFLASTRGQVVALLRQGLQTVDELARALHLTDNAVRAHLTALERDGLVAQTGWRRGGRKPAYVYALTPDAERLFPKAYATVLDLLLDVLREHLPADTLDSLVREVGRRLAQTQTAPHGDLRSRVDGAVGLISDLGGLATMEERDDGFVILGRSCPLAAVVEGHPEACLMAETLLTEVIGSPVHQACDPVAPRCQFVIDASHTLRIDKPNGGDSLCGDA
jgi:predicted ArsR family transcriptional regulator